MRNKNANWLCAVHNRPLSLLHFHASTTTGIASLTPRQFACQASPRQAVAVGIDLGTTSSSIAIVEGKGRARVIHSVPSVVHFKQDGSVLVGEEAVDASSSDPGASFYSIKRLIGRTVDQMQEWIEGLAYQVVEGPEGLALLEYQLMGEGGGTDRGSTQGKPMLVRPEEISAQIVRHLIHQAEQQILGTEDQVLRGGWKLEEAVVTIPDHFRTPQKQATIEACRLAGLKRVTLLQEPVAAAMAYGFGRPTDWDVILVFDLGGGTLDLSLIEAFEGIMEVVATGGDAKLGGDDFTAAASTALLSAVPGWENVVPSKLSPASRLALRQWAETAKVGLSFNDSIEMEVPGTFSEHPREGGDDVASSSSSGSPSSSLPPLTTPSSLRRLVTLTRADLEAASLQLISRLWPPLERLAKETRTQLGGELPSGILVGGESSPGEDSPAAASAPGMDRYKGGRSFEVFVGKEAAQSLPTKWAAQPRRLTGVVLVGAATRMPGVRDLIQKVTGLEAAEGVDPEEAVALGAAIYAGVLQGLSPEGVELTDGSYVAGQHGRSSTYW